MAYGYSVSYLGKPPTTHAEGFASRVVACGAAASRFGLTDSELAQLYTEGFLYMREPHTHKLTSNCITVWENAS